MVCVWLWFSFSEMYTRASTRQDGDFYAMSKFLSLSSSPLPVPSYFFFSSSVKDSVSSSNSTWINLIYFSVCLQNGSRSIARWIFSQTMHAFSNCGDQPRVKVLIAGSHSNPTPSLLLERELLIAWNKRSFSDPHGERQFQHICFGELIYDHRQF